jgi:hypothetical protein
MLYVLATYCQVYPSEYAYRDDSVTRAESASANCRRYPVIGDLPAGIYSVDHIHCDGTQLKLADSDLGSEQFSSTSYFQHLLPQHHWWQQQILSLSLPLESTRSLQ